MVGTLRLDRGVDIVGIITRVELGLGKEAVSIEELETMATEGREQKIGIEESKVDGTKKGSKVANQGSKIGREEGEGT